MSKLLYGDSAARKVSERIGESVATIAALKAIPANKRVPGMLIAVLADMSLWRFHGTSALTGDDVLTVAPTAGSGRWLRVPGGAVLKLPITYATSDAAVLLTVPTGCRLHLLEVWWEVSADFTGGSSSTIGVSSNKTGFTTKGDLLGGAAGSLAAALTAAGSPNFGTIGAGFDTLAKRRVTWNPTDNVRHDRITSAYTAGAGNVCLSVNILQHNGA